MGIQISVGDKRSPTEPGKASAFGLVSLF